MNLTLTRQPLGQLLLGRGVVAPAQLEVALAEQRRGARRKLLGEILVESRLCSEEQVAEALAESYGVPFARVGPRMADPKVVAVLPRDFLQREQVLPLVLVDGVLTVAVAEPANVFLLDEVRRLTGHKVQPVAATSADIAAALGAYQFDRQRFAADDVAPGNPHDAAPDAFRVVPRLGAGHAEVDGPSPARRLALACLYAAIKESATDVHFDPGDGGARVRYRIDGRLVERMRPPPQTHAALVAALKAMAGAPAGGTHGAAEGVIRVQLDGRPMDLRLAAAPVGHGERVVVRVGDGGRPPFRLEKLGFGYETLKQWRRVIGTPRGLVLVTGPAGSGKRTTLCSTLAELDAGAMNVCAVGDVLDRSLPGVSHFRPDAAAGHGNAAALRAALAQDPDVVVLPAVADPEEGRLAAGAATAGTLVLCGVHAPDPVGAVCRLAAVGVDPFALGSSVAGVLAQRLVRRLCPQCREAYDATPAERRQMERHGKPAATLYRPRGCTHCRGTGYAGRIALFELLLPTDALSDAICRGAARGELVHLAQQAGMTPLRADGAEKVAAGVTTLQEVQFASAVA